MVKTTVRFGRIAVPAVFLLICLCVWVAGCGEPSDGNGTQSTATTTEVTEMTAETEGTTVTETVTDEETTSASAEAAPNFTADDVKAHKAIPLFADMDVPYYSDTVGLLPTIAPYIVDDSPACVLIFPGGGYFQRTDGEEGIEIAEAYNAAGISAFLVRYRYDANGVNGNVTYDRHAFMADAQRSVQFVRYYADEFGIDRDKVAVCGFSAGGHLAMVISEHADELYDGAADSAIGRCDSHPDMLILGYPLVNMEKAYYTVPIIFLNGDKDNQTERDKYSYAYRVEALPPTFMFAYKKDNMVSVKLNEEPMAAAMEAAGLTVECHIFNDGAHGVGLGKSYKEYSGWFDLSVSFIKTNFSLSQ